MKSKSFAKEPAMRAGVAATAAAMLAFDSMLLKSEIPFSKKTFQDGSRGGKGLASPKKCERILRRFEMPGLLVQFEGKYGGLGGMR